MKLRHLKHLFFVRLCELTQKLINYSLTFTLFFFHSYYKLLVIVVRQKSGYQLSHNTSSLYVHTSIKESKCQIRKILFAYYWIFGSHLLTKEASKSIIVYFEKLSTVRNINDVCYTFVDNHYLLNLENKVISICNEKFMIFYCLYFRLNHKYKFFDFSIVGSQSLLNEFETVYFLVKYHYVYRSSLSGFGKVT